MYSDIITFMEGHEDHAKVNLLALVLLAIYADENNGTNNWREVTVLDGIGHVIMHSIHGKSHVIDDAAEINSILIKRKDSEDMFLSSIKGWGCMFIVNLIICGVWFYVN